MPARCAAIRAGLVVFCAALPLWPAATQLRGNITMADGSAPGESVELVMTCREYTGPSTSEKVTVRGKTGKRGEYQLEWSSNWHQCSLTASAGDYSKAVELDSFLARYTGESSFWLPNIPLSRTPANSTQRGQEALLASMVSALDSKNWPKAEADAREILQANPNFITAWSALAASLEVQGKRAEAREAYARALSLNPALTSANVALLRLQMQDADWYGAARTAARLLEGPGRDMPGPHLDMAEIRYRLRDLDGAEAELKNALRIDPAGALERANALSASIREARDSQTAIAVAKPPLPAPNPRVAEPKTGASPRVFPDTEEIPGGMRALAAIVHMDGDLDPSNFLAAYCRKVVEPGNSSPGAAFIAADLKAYFAAMPDLEALALDGRVELDLERDRRRVERVLGLFGWKLQTIQGGIKVVADIRPEAGSRQQIPAALGIDEPTMVRALENGGVFSFPLEHTPVRLAFATEWRALTGQEAPGAIAALLGGNTAYAMTYAGLAAMDAGSAAALLASRDLKTLVEKCAGALFLNGAAMAVDQGRAAVPGGAAAAPVWQSLVGADPADPKAFFPGLLEKDRGSLAAFYHAIAQGDEAHRRFFTATNSRAARFYSWLRSASAHTEPWRKDLFRNLPLDAAGNVRYAGNKIAWTTFTGAEEETLLRLPSLEALLAAARIEERRGAPLAPDAARLFAAHFDSWRALMPYFEVLPGLGAGELQALEEFERAASKRPLQELNGILGQWHAIVKLAVLATQAGSLDAPAAARAFRRACGLATAGNTPGETNAGMAALREMAGGAANLDEAVPSRLLRLGGGRRASFDRVRSLQKVPTLADASAHPELRPAALAGLVYAATLDPRTLLISEDSAFFGRHQFVPEQRLGSIFFPSELRRDPVRGSYLAGGFAGLEETTATLGRSPAQAVEGTSETTAEATTEVVFRGNASLVEVYTTVTDPRGEPVDGLERDSFTIVDNGKEVPVEAFESQVTNVSVALVLDTTVSMQPAMGALRGAALNLIDDVRPGDSLAVFRFDDKASTLLDFTTDKDAARRSVLHTYAQGGTALYDALVYVNRSFLGRAGKKAIIVFTDGEDSASGLPSQTAIERARIAGIPIYTIAHGFALNSTAQSSALRTELAAISRATGGTTYAVNDDARLAEIFAAITRDLTRGYLLAFKPTTPAGTWHELKVKLNGPETRNVRARLGYHPD